MENNRSKFESHIYLVNCKAEKLEIQISQSGDAARYQSTIRWSSRGTEVIYGRWQEIRYSKRDNRPYITMFGKRLYLTDLCIMNAADKKFNYMMLSRLRQDCEYYLGYGNRNAKHSLWAQDEQKQIDKMRELYDLLPIKPEWLTREQIDEYAAKMGAH